MLMCYPLLTILGVLHKYARVYNYYFFLSLFLQAQHIFSVKCIGRICVMFERMFVFRLFSSLGFFLNNCLDWQLLD